MTIILYKIVLVESVIMNRFPLPPLSMTDTPETTEKEDYGDDWSFLQVKWRVRDLERKIENNVRFAGLPRWQRILDGAITYFLSFMFLMILMTAMEYLFPALLR